MMQFGPSTIVPNNSGDGFPRMTPAIIPTVVPTTIVREVLTESNYENWSTCVKWYLVGQDLWEVCRTKDNIPDEARDPEAFSVWEKKNAMALHAIQISCSGEMLSQIRRETCHYKKKRATMSLLESVIYKRTYIDAYPSVILPKA
ncbi:hypothetical protein CK203_044169 [Vitis vinifera]|uniref:DUF4219 domain-containing protein n=1 Tax=Vitis vinifera TaxID=29760 RepID=A0A438I2Q7_VITVI|nr:hypothetical protein CK203_044169 [Vitis vinifera]